MRSLCFWVGGVVVWNEHVWLEAVKHWKLEEESEWGGLPRSEAPFLQYLFVLAETQSSREKYLFLCLNLNWQSLWVHLFILCEHLLHARSSLPKSGAAFEAVSPADGEAATGRTDQPAFTLPLTLSARVADQEHGRCLKPWWMIWGGSLNTLRLPVVDAWSCGTVVRKSQDCVDIDPTRYAKGLISS